MLSPRHLPPAVRYPVTRSPWLGWLGAVCWLGSAALLLAWWVMGGPQPVGVLFAGVGLWLLAGAALLQAWWQAPQGQFLWDGGAWWWQGVQDVEGAAIDRLQLRLDAQNAMLVAWRCPSGGWRMAWVVQRSEPWHWGDWRRAVYSAAAVFRQAESRA